MKTLKRLFLFISFASATWMLHAQNTLKLADFEDGIDCFSGSDSNPAGTNNGITKAIVNNPSPDDINKSSKALQINVPSLAGGTYGVVFTNGTGNPIPVGEGTGKYRYLHFKLLKSKDSRVEWQFRDSGGVGKGWCSVSASGSDEWQYIVMDLMESTTFCNVPAEISNGTVFYGYMLCLDKGSTIGSSFTAYVDDFFLSDSPDEENGEPVIDGWKLVFEDNFNGTSVNTINWSMYNGPGHVQNGLRKPEAFSVDDGSLVVTAQMKDGQLVSGGMAHRKNYLYGRFEFRVRADADPSSATSAVVLTWPESGKWPDDGELDIYETGSGSSRYPFHTFIHYGASNSQLHYIHNVDGKEWHTMMCEWLPDKLTIFRDGTAVWNTTSTYAIPQVAHHLCVQLDATKTTMTGSVKMYVDWVKIYQKQDEGTGIHRIENVPMYYDRNHQQLYPGNLSGKLLIINPDGRIALSREVATNETVDLGSLAKGIYLVHLAGQTFKIIK